MPKCRKRSRAFGVEHWDNLASRMPGISELLRNHIDYTVWATERLLEASQDLQPDELVRDFGTADKSVQGTLTHIFRAERTWLSRIQKSTPSIPWGAPADEQWPVLLEEWRNLHQAWGDWARTLSEAETETPLDYSDLKGKQWKQAIWQIVLHVVNHSTHHRGQVAGFLRALGKSPPPLDFIAFTRLQI